MIERRKFITLLLAGTLLAAVPQAAHADEGSGSDGDADHSGSGGGGGDDGNSGPGGGGGDDGDNSGPGGGGGDDDNSGPGGGDAEDDEKDRQAASKAVREGRAVPLRELLRMVKEKYPGDVVDVKLRRAGRTMTYRVRVLDRHGRLLTLSVDAASKRITRAQGL
jgi:hypothetical protein